MTGMPATRAMTAADAQMFWMSAAIPSDQLVLYAFEGSPGDPDAAVAELLRRDTWGPPAAGSPIRPSPYGSRS